MKPVKVGVIGAGYWGPNLIRNFQFFEGCDLAWVCDLSLERARKAVGPRSLVRISDSVEDLLSDDELEAVAVAVPASLHFDIGLACLEAGKHVLIEKPLASSVAEASKLIDVAKRADLVLMCDHTHCFTPAARKIRDLIRDGSLGDIHYFDSVRINLGLVHSDVDVFWDLAPHDLSILDFVLPDHCRVETVSAHGVDPIGAGHACMGYLTLNLSNGAIAHIHVNWLSPTKVRTTMIGGSKRIAIWDDLHPSQRVSVYDKGVDLVHPVEGDARRQRLVSYRTGDMVAPVLSETEALHGVVQEFAMAIREHRPALTDGEAGLRVVKILDAIPRSQAGRGAAIPLQASRASGWRERASE